VLVSNATWHVGDTREVLKTLPSASVDLVVTSPPFLALRSYLPADHPDKALEIGSEGTPGAFLDALLDVTEELARVLAPHGSLVVELGDTYSGSTADGGDNRGNDRYPAGRSFVKATRDRSEGWPQNKSLCMIPSSYAWALAYGRNPWTGRTTDPWRVRNLIAWCRPNPPVGALGDKFRPGTSYLTVACKSGSRYFDLDAVREPFAANTIRTEGLTRHSEKVEGAPGGGRPGVRENMMTHAGAPPLDWWEIPTHPYPGSHYATFPPQLVVRPVKAMCPQSVCRTCGKPRTRITETTQLDTGRTTNGAKPRDRAESFAGTTYEKRTEAHVETLGWSDCGHNDWRNGVVLDPFAGSGTTGEVATGHGRDFVGIDLDPRNLELARQRIGMFLVEAA
jgi:site-specific DNA-methyltransferase (adenine-specific)